MWSKIDIQNLNFIKKFYTINQTLTITCPVHAFMTKSTTCVIKLSPSYQIIFLAREAAQVNFPDGKSCYSSYSDIT